MVRLQAACHTRHQHVGDTVAGYSHTYFYDEGASLNLFSQYPLDECINSLAQVMHNEACYLWSLLGYKHSEALSVIPSGPQLEPGGSIPDDLGDTGENEDAEDQEMISNHRELLMPSRPVHDLQTENSHEPTLSGYMNTPLPLLL